MTRNTRRLPALVAALAIPLMALPACSASSQRGPDMSAPPTDPTPAASRDPSPIGPEPEALCGVELFERHVGEDATEALLASIREARGKKPMRVLPPGSVMTMDFRQDRLNVLTDEDNIITTMRCG
ncbi:I78 family peptidase inhibitor [Novosphingobium sp. BW1]|uniref:I78 family peptidase inhibitor n=1 Tax=Novosphingobium sp. BW1 TaxID=2592621 RepID=UPI0011DEA9D4|nr:I78 family peptidase inhibitor [Novosphingobium sp. BW1]TYC90728.1 hypothetical protein FMM79_05505 [Novosphingobium sp. BW1]